MNKNDDIRKRPKEERLVIFAWTKEFSTFNNIVIFV